MSCHVYEFEVWTWRTWLYIIASRFQLCNFRKEIKLQLITNKYFGHCVSNLLFVNCIVLGYSSLNISSTIRDLKLKGMPKYKQVWTWHIFLACLEFMKIWFRNISSAKLEWKECTRRIKDCFFSVLWLTQAGYSFSTSLDSLFYLLFCQLLPSA